MKGWIFQSGRPLALAVGVFILLMPTFAVFAQDDAPPPYMAPERILSALQKEVTIQVKTPVDVLADRARYAVTPATIITMGDDTLPLSDMLVPCKAMIYYEKRKNQDSEAVKIKILDFAVGADTEWAVPSPE